MFICVWGVSEIWQLCETNLHSVAFPGRMFPNSIGASRIALLIIITHSRNQVYMHHETKDEQYYELHDSNQNTHTN